MVVDSRPLDVVAETAAHQQNLNPPARALRHGVLALPLPEICLQAVTGAFAELRRRQLNALANDLERVFDIERQLLLAA